MWSIDFSCPFEVRHLFSSTSNTMFAPTAERLNVLGAERRASQPLEGRRLEASAERDARLSHARVHEEGLLEFLVVAMMAPSIVNVCVCVVDESQGLVRHFVGLRRAGTGAHGD